MSHFRGLLGFVLLHHLRKIFILSVCKSLESFILLVHDAFRREMACDHARESFTAFPLTTTSLEILFPGEGWLFFRGSNKRYVALRHKNSYKYFISGGCSSVG